MTLVCKLLAFVFNIFVGSAKLLITSVHSVGKLLIASVFDLAKDVVDDAGQLVNSVLKNVSSALFSSPLGLILIGLGAFLIIPMFTKDKDKEVRVTSLASPSLGVP